ncbi:hypothetical protein R8Z50_33165 [Longispora sp. K20-0274]|uniref:hypothetical protein n=1 Tax=Longispora sp. K20-0274 TaxID=3088255 RepID=UPI00399BFB37
MTGITAGDDAEALAPPAQRMRPESAPEPPEVDHAFWPDTSNAAAPPQRARIKPPKDYRRPALGLPLLVVFALCAAFFAWVSAEPFWLALGHGDRGTLTVTECAGSGLAARCEGRFAATGFSVEKAALAGTADDEHHTGDQLTAVMVSGTSKFAYAGDATGLHLRWAIGFGLLLLCGAGIAWATGALRLHGRARVTVLLLSLGAPLLLLLGNLALTW